MSEPLLAQAQALVASAYPMDAWYNRAYRAEERQYWYPHAPTWLEALPRGARVLDIGCAYGTLAVYARLRGLQVAAMDARDDFQPHSLFQELGIDFRRADVEREPIPFVQRFDAVVLTEVIEHWNFQPVPTLRKIAAALRPGGALIVTTPDAESAWGRTTKYYPDLASLPQPGQAEAWIDDHVWQYSLAELVAVLEDAGFAVEWVGHSERNTYTHSCVLARRIGAAAEEESFAARLCVAHAAAVEAAAASTTAEGARAEVEARCADLATRLQQAEVHCAALLARAETAEAERDALLSSTSWRLMAPLRSAAEAVRKRA